MAFLQANTGHTRTRHLPGLRGHGVGDLTGVGAVVHQQKLEVLLIAEEQFSESICQHVTGLFSRAIANGREGLVASELTTDSAINTVGSSPRSLQTNSGMTSYSQLTPTLLYLSEAKRLGWFFCFLMILVLFKAWTAIYLYLIKNLNERSTI